MPEDSHNITKHSKPAREPNADVRPKPAKTKKHPDTDSKVSAKLKNEFQKIINATHHDPFCVLGRHPQGNLDVARAYLPYAHDVYLADVNAPMSRIHETDIFEWRGAKNILPNRYRIQWSDQHNNKHLEYDPYCFPPQLTDFDLHLFGEGKHWHAYQFLGAHTHSIDGIPGVLFAIWAPNVNRVSVIGDFNQWDGRRYPMRSRGSSGVWELFIPGIKSGGLYKFELLTNQGHILVKSDPYGQAFEMRPSNASIVVENTPFLWQDNDWQNKRQNKDWLHQPMSAYEVHLGSWRRDAQGNFLNYAETVKQLVEYVLEMGFTHLQLLPLTEHPLDASWGYQTTGYFAPTSRFGDPDDFRYFVNYCHQNDIGIIMDWVPAHFPKDNHALAQFDGTALYEHDDPRRGEHRDWGTLIYNYGRNEVKNFLLSSAYYWLAEYHIDGLRVDAVASMLYLDYSREDHDWIPNVYGGNENLEAIDFLRELNSVIHGQFPGCLMIAEESTAWPQVTRPTWLGGLGFSMKWNMGWMHDTLQYMSKDPIHRPYHHNQLSFGLLYSFTENFVLPFSHDEVVHGKGSMLNKMPGDEWQRFANLRLLYTYMFTYPGKKLLFMGCEFGQGTEWDVDRELDWYVLEYPVHQGVQKLVADLNRLYKASPQLYQYDFQHEGFEWIDCHDADQSVISFLRKSDNSFLIVALNFTPMPRYDYRIGVPENACYQEIHNSDSEYYGGSNVGNLGKLKAENIEWMGRPYSLRLTLPPLAGIVLKVV